MRVHPYQRDISPDSTKYL
ncbi:MAG: hypothetical protein JXX14_15835 [Deltaproteobacteria bacterium]|nr:hypothetical protein [Deltaproteobacteria bacterium]